MNTRPLISRNKREGETFDQSFVADIVEGLSYEDALERNITGGGKVRRAAALQTLNAIAGLHTAELNGLLAWARKQIY